jgi:hypothetical protein
MMSLHTHTAYLDTGATIRKGRYHDGSTALVLDDAVTGERLANAAFLAGQVRAALS